jgi:hypothetical protein
LADETAITVLTPLKRDAPKRLAVVFWLARRLAFEKLRQLASIHRARWAVVTAFPDGGDGELLHHSYLYFEGDFAGPWERHLEAVAEVMPRSLDALWGMTFGYPGAIPVERLKAYVRRNQFAANHQWCAYPRATPNEIHSARRVALALDSFRHGAADLEPPAFKAAYDAFLTSVQRDL